MVSVIQVSLVLLVACCASNASFFPGKKCSMLEYLSASQTCQLESWKKVMTDYKGPQQTGKDLWHMMMDVLSTMCSGSSLERMFRCQREVNKMCDFSLQNMDKMEKMSKLMCSKIDELRKLSKCFLPKMDDFAVCLSSVRFDSKDSNPLCRLADAYRACFRPNFVHCETETTKTVFDLIDHIVLDKCSSAKISGYKVGGRKCSLMEHLITTTMCWAPYAKRLVDRASKLIRSAPPNATDLTELCGADDALNSLDCQDAVDKHCEQSIVNAHELKNAVKPLCENLGEFTTLDTCALKPQEFLKCVMEQSEKDQTVCEFVKRVRGCLNILLRRCFPNLRKTMLMLYEAVSPQQCSEYKGGEKCSAVEFVSNIAMCWMPFSIRVSTRSYGPGPEPDSGHPVRLTPRDRITNFVKRICNMDEAETALSCHERVDQMCGMSLVKAHKIKKLYSTLCDYPKAIHEFYPCLAKIFKDVRETCPNKIKSINVKDADGVCSTMNSQLDCVMDPMTDQCDKKVKYIVEKANQAFLPSYCSTGSYVSVTLAMLLLSLLAAMSYIK